MAVFLFCFYTSYSFSKTKNVNTTSKSRPSNTGTFEILYSWTFVYDKTCGVLIGHH